MPIRDLIESYKFGDGLPRLAIIRKGAPKVSEDRPGADLVTHFRVVMQAPYERYQSVVEQLFGDKPELFAPVRFFAPNMEDVYSFWMSESSKTKLLHQCDGETETRWFDPETGKNMRGERSCSGKAADGGCGCKPSAELRCYLPTLNQEIGLPGYVSFVTTSWNDVRNLMACFLDIERMGFHDLRRVEFAIGRAMRPINTPVARPKDEKEAAEFRKKFKHDWKPGEKAKRSKSLMYLRVTEKFSREFVLPPPLANAQLPAAGAPQLESVTGRAIVTADTPRQERRISALASAPPLRFEPDEEDVKVGPPLRFEPDEEDEDDDEIQIGEMIDEDGVAQTSLRVGAPLIQPDDTPRWTDEEGKWNGFLQWVNQHLKLTAKTVTETLVDFEALQLGDWRRVRRWATAAVVAEAMGYDAGRIEVYTSSMGGDPDTAVELNALALQIVARREQLADAETA